MGAPSLLLPPFSPVQQHRRRISLPISPPASPTRQPRTSGTRHSISGHLPPSPPITPPSLTHPPPPSSTPPKLSSSSSAKTLLAAFSRPSSLPLHQPHPSYAHHRSPSLVQLRLRPILTPKKVLTLFLILLSATYLTSFLPSLSPLHLLPHGPSNPSPKPDSILREPSYTPPSVPARRTPQRIGHEAAVHIFGHESAGLDFDKISLADAITKSREALLRLPAQKMRKARLGTERGFSEEARGWSTEGAERRVGNVMPERVAMVEGVEAPISGGTHGEHQRAQTVGKDTKKVRQLMALQKARLGNSRTGPPRVAVVKEEVKYLPTEGARRKPLKQPPA